ncbi:MAG: restriction endonuclease subunit [Microbacterium sp.]|nr:restriction endonuclease subunit [Microbacterium sp.]
MTRETVPLGEAARLVGGGTPSKARSDYWGEGVPWITSADIADDGTIVERAQITPVGVASNPGSIAAANSVLLVTRTGVGKTALTNWPLAFSQDIVAFTDHPRIDASYLRHFLRSSSSALKQRARGATILGVTRDDVLSLRIPLPPLPEQRRIAAILDEAEALNRPATTALRKLAALRQSLFASAVSEVRTRVSIADVALKVTDGTHQAPGWSITGVPFLFVSNITSGSIDYSTTKYVSPETYDRLTRHSPIEKGDVLYSAVGSYGVPAVVDSDEPFLFQRHIAHIKPRPDVVDSWYLHAALGSSDFLNQAHKVARGVAQKTVTLGDLSRLTIPLPNVEAQRHVAEQLKAVRRAHTIVTHQRSSIRTLFASLQHRAFRGEL